MHAQKKLPSKFHPSRLAKIDFRCAATNHHSWTRLERLQAGVTQRRWVFWRESSSLANKHKLGPVHRRERVEEENKKKGRNSRLQVLEDSVDGSPVDEQVAVHPVHGCCASVCGERRAFVQCKGRWPTALPDAVLRQGRGRSQTARLSACRPHPRPQPSLRAFANNPLCIWAQVVPKRRQKGAPSFGEIWCGGISWLR